jgi:hypothetical protein
VEVEMDYVDLQEQELLIQVVEVEVITLEDLV